MSFFKSFFGQPKNVIEVKFVTSGGLLQSDYSESDIPVEELQAIAKEYGLNSYDQDQVILLCTETLQCINLARYANIPETVVANFSTLEFKLKSLCVYKAINPYQYRLDVQNANDSFQLKLPKNRIGKRESNCLTQPDRFVRDFALNLEVAIHHEMSRLFDQLQIEIEKEDRPALAAQWLPYFRNHASQLNDLLDGEGFAVDSKSWVTGLGKWARMAKK